MEYKTEKSVQNGTKIPPFGGIQTAREAKFEAALYKLSLGNGDAPTSDRDLHVGILLRSPQPQ